jgi:cellulose synthase/poly-beta-1,6-N-acetylglucosamine synthase-like glycosyltransferase
MPKVSLPYHVRVLVPCYKEELEICQRTVLAAAAAPLPAGCKRTVYLCDDGRDKAKRDWIRSLGDPTQFVYVSGRERKKGEMNGKSANLNNVCSQLYPKEVAVVPGNELVCVFDADQVATSRFFARTIPLFDGGDDVAMVLSPQVRWGRFGRGRGREERREMREHSPPSCHFFPPPFLTSTSSLSFFCSIKPPQCFHNLDLHCDVFNHSNIHFWE